MFDKKDLAAVTYPASKQDILIIAEGNGADTASLDELELLPDVDFESIMDVEEAIMSKRGFKNEKRTLPGKNITGEPDHRLLENETEALHSARHMEHGYDGRGRVRNQENDARLKENRASESPKVSKRQTWREFSK